MASTNSRIQRRFIFIFILGCLSIIATISSVELLLNLHRANHLQPDTIEPAPGRDQWPRDFRNALYPLLCHSHNDEMKQEPLYQALRLQCSSIEVDIHPSDEDVFIGHSRASFSPGLTLRKLYLEPLLHLLDEANNDRRNRTETSVLPLKGVFASRPYESLVLQLDLKTFSATTTSLLNELLQPLRERGYLTRMEGSALIRGPLTIVAGGSVPPDLIQHNSSHHDIFYSAYMKDLTSIDKSPAAHGRFSRLHGPAIDGTFSVQNSLSKSVGFVWNRLSESQVRILRQEIHAAHAASLTIRYWGLPKWPASRREHVWDVLLSEGVDYINVDDLEDAAQWAAGQRPVIDEMWDGVRRQHDGVRRVHALDGR